MSPREHGAPLKDSRPPRPPVPDFWSNGGFHLLQRDDVGWLALSDDFLRACLLRPEIAGRAVYLAFSSEGDDVVRMKPRNLLVNLPLAARS